MLYQASNLSVVSITHIFAPHNIGQKLYRFKPINESMQNKMPHHSQSFVTPESGFRKIGGCCRTCGTNAVRIGKDGCRAADARHAGVTL
jgi:hypothetical protein